ncbi:Translation initiation factor IF-2 InfB [Paucilactobacillus oligofermentans DSM 15707 = LMG 22743]|uniref:translation initiation factor IF-2 n=1 Tax=Paucilactobacillus oligofermentans TaxID=293371 RepID=UPI00078DCE98|nr:translation initiation factor IF-2 [Paucilactobacillus oligofermentans]CUS26369.1 Translation initiation factor IF-2 InfB [Paucilactobacillus oligofermentans DSM 15707 = LMG 22743]
MAKERIYELAKELNVESKVVIDAATKKGISVKNHMSSIEDKDAATIKQSIKGGASAPAKKTSAPVKPTSSSTAVKPASSTNNVSHSSNNSSRPQSNGQSRPSSNSSRPQSNGQNRPSNNSSRPQSNGQSRPSSNSSHPQSNGQSRPSNNGSRPQTNGQSRPSNNGSRPQTNGQSRPSNNGSRPQSGGQSRPSNNGSRPQSGGQSRPSNNSSRPQSGGQSRPSNNSSRPQSGGQSRPSTSSSRPQGSSNGGGRFGGSLNSGGNGGGGNSSRRGKGGYRGNNQNRYTKKKKIKTNGRIKETAVQTPAPTRKERPLPETLVYSVGMNAQDLGKVLHREPAELIKKLFMLGVMVNQNQSLDSDTIEILAADYGIEAEQKAEVDVADIDKFFDEEQENLVDATPRPPVVTVMGHVDHGKTTLLDKLRHTHVTDGEAGGITQAIGAYQVNYNDKMITFLDTPGHAAFTEMRARGANVTDITVLVVAADDGVMPQTIEAINHAKAAGTPIIVAVNKIDKPDANPDHVTEQLAAYDLVPESWGGDTIFVKISAKMGENLDELLDMILLQAEVLELKANPNQRAAGSVVEARLDKGKGTVATLLIQQGTMHVGDPVVVGNTYGRVRTMTNENGRRIKIATPSTPVEITGLSGVPDAGDRFVVFEDEKTARTAGEERAKRALLKERANTTHVTLDNLFDSLKEGELKSVPVIIKADVQGSVEALAQSLKKIKVDGVKVDIIHTAVGAINESDVTLAEASNAIIIGFNVRPTPQAKVQVESGEVDVRLHRVIYNAIDEVESAMKGMLEPVYVEEVTGEVEIKELYKVSKIGTIAGGMVTTGRITRDAGIRLIRDGVVIYEGKLGSLKRFKDDVKEVKAGFDLGLTVENYNDIKVDDVIEAYVMKEVPVE